MRSRRSLTSKQRRAILPACYKIDLLESRLLLSSVIANASADDGSSPTGVSSNQGSSASAILAGLQSGLTGQFASAGLEISKTAEQGIYTPDYVMLDAQPQLSADNTLEPFSTASPTGLTPAQVRHAYGIDQVMFGTIQGDGAGQTIAIIDTYDYPTMTTDLHAFDVAFGLPDPPSVTKVNETGGSTLPGTDPSGKGDDWEVEEALDVEWSHAMAPDANILLVEASSPTDADLIDSAVNYARSVPGVVAISMSFGGSESSSESSLDTYFTTPAGHTGITFLASTGDSGAPGGYPAYSPNVLATGGTTLNVDASGDYISESGWSLSGGGLSSYEPQPTYQNGVVTQSSTQRAIPDVSFDADPDTGVAIYDTYDFGTTDPWIVVGGTSVAAPSWAGIIAVVDQGAVHAGGSPLNGLTQTLPLLYKLPAASNFHDITTGNNGYPAGVGYDLVTGIGSPIANQLIPNLVQASNPYLHVVSSTPAQGGSVFGTPPVQFTLTLSAAADPATLQDGDFAVNGIAPSSVTLDPTDTVLTLQYSSSPMTAGGNQTITVAAGAVDRQSDETAIQAYSGSFIYAPVQLQVVSSTPSSTVEMQLPLQTMSVNLNEEVNPASVSASDLTLSQGTVTNAALQAGDTSIVFTISGLTTEEYVTASIAAGVLTDQYGAAGAAFSTTFATHIATSALPAATSVAPLGSQIYQSTASGLIGIPSDTDSYTISLNAGQNLTVVVHPTGSSLTPAVSILDPSSNVLGNATAGGAGQDVVIETVPITKAGTYTVIVAGNGTTVGPYSLEVLLNSAVELAEHNGPPDNTIGSAQNLNPAFNSLNGASGIASVLGALNVTTTDYYSVTLAAGETVTAAETILSGTGTPTLTLINSSGTTVASGVTGATNVSLDIAGYVAPAAGVYYVEVAGSGNSYSLVVLTNAAFSLEPHNTSASAQNITSTPEALGYLGNAPGGTVVTLTATDSGWWDSTGYNTTSNKNYITGECASNGYNSFYVFSLAGITQPIAAAQIEIYNPAGGYSSANSSETLGFFDVSTPIATLEAGGSGETAIYNDLGTGVSYGTNTVSAADDSLTVSTGLNSAAISALNAAEGTQFAIGGSLPLVTGTVNRFIFGNSGGNTPQLALTLGGGADWYSFNVTSTGQAIAFSTSTPSEGTGQFTDTLDPHIQIYDPNGNLVASGTKLPDGRNELVTYQPLITGTYTIELTAQNGTAGEYELSQGNALGLTLPANATKGEGSVTGAIAVTNAPATNLTINLISSDPTLLTVPATVILLAGQTSVPLPLDFIDDHLLDGPQDVSITASATGYFSGSGIVDVHDNETATLSVTLPTNATKGQGIISGSITSSAAPARNIVVQLTSSNPSELSVPATVTLQAGQTSIAFNATVLQDTVLDGTQNVTVTASVENWTSGTANVSIADDNNTIAVTLPSSGWEGQTFSGGGTVTLGGTPLTNLVVNLASSDPAELSVPATVTVLAGKTSATFNVTLINDAVKHGPLSETVTATATGLVTGAASITVYDSTLDHFVFTSITGPETAGTAFAATADAYNAENELIATYGGSLALSALGKGGSEPVTPTTGTFSSGVWSGSVTLTTADPSVTLTLTSGGLNVTSSAFVVQPAAVSTFSWGAVSSPQIAGIPVSETITAQDAYGNTATGFNGNANLSGLVGSTVSETMLGNATPTDSYNNGSYTMGYSFTPASSIQVTAVRSYFGGKVEIWTSGGTLLVSQPVSGTNGTWTETPLGTPLTLTGGTTYVLGVYSAGQTYYWGTGMSGTTPIGTINEDFWITGDAFPTTGDTSSRWFFVDLRANVGAFTSVPMTPTTATFVNGVWTGNITVAQAATGMHLHVDDGSGQTGDSNKFDVIQQVLILGLPTDVEQNAGVVDGLLSVTPSPTSDVVVSLTSSDPSRLTVPSTLTIPAGQSYVTLPLTLTDTDLLLALEQITITANATGYPTDTGTVNVHDNETAVLSITLPATAKESDGSAVGTITASAAPAQNVTIDLTSSDPSQATVPTTVTLLAGQTSVNFNVTILNPGIIEASPTFVTVGAHVDNWTDGFATIAIQNTDNYITVSLPASGWEGQTFTGAGTVTIGGTLTTSLVVNLSSNNTAELGLPTSVTIAPGQTSATFNVNLLQDGVENGTQNVTVTATASGLTSGTSSITVYDSTLAYVGFNSITGPQTDAVAFPVTLSAYNIANQVIAVYSGSASLSAAGSKGSLSMTPTSVTFSSGKWTGNVTVNGVDPTVTLTANAGGGIVDSSNPFALQAGPVASFQISSVASPQTAGAAFSETITAEDVNGYTANYNGTANLNGFIGTATTASMLGAAVPTYAYNYGTFTIGYSFTPSSNLQVTAVRSYAGSKVEIWSLGGTLLLSQPVSGPNGSWTVTPVSTPLNLTAGVTYVIGTYTAGQTYYGNEGMSSSTPIATIDQGYEIGGDAFPTLADTWRWIFVDLVAAIGTATSVPIAPTTATFVNGVWTGNVTALQPASGMYLQVNDGAGHTANSNTFNVLPAATAAPVLSAASDTGISSTDGITKLNNSSPSTALTFIVGNTVSGAVVTLYSDGIAIGSSTATGTTTNVTTDGVTKLADGGHTITAIQTISGLQSAISPGESITVDTSTPTATITVVTPNPQGTPVASINIAFSEKVYGLTLSGLTLSVNGGPNLLTSSQTLTSVDGITWTLGNLSNITDLPGGTYTLSLAAAAAQSTAGDLSSAATQSWQYFPTLSVPTPAAANSNPVTGASTALSVLGAENGSDAGLNYQWSYTGPTGVAFAGPTNGTNAAKNITAKFTQPGNYTFTATISDSGGYSITSSVMVVVQQTAANVVVSPASTPVVPVGFQQQFSATVCDQFGNTISSPSCTWGISGPGNSIDCTGNATLGSTPGSYLVTACSGNAQGTATVIAENFAVPSGSVLNISLGAPGPVTVAAGGADLTASQNGIQFTSLDSTGITVTDAGPNDVLNFNGPLSIPFSFVNCGGSTVNVKSGTLIFAPVMGGNVSLGTLSVARGAEATIAFATTQNPTTLNVNSLSIAVNGVLDLTNNEMIVAYGASDPIATIAADLNRGYNNGTWTGPGIDSSAAALSKGAYGVGFADGADGLVQGLGSGQIELKYTLNGDANLDGQVNGEDFTILASNFNQSATGWDQGDFNYLGVVNGENFTILASNFNQSANLNAPGILAGGGAMYAVTGSAGTQTLDILSGTVTLTSNLSALLPNYSLRIENGATVVLASNQRIGALQLVGSGSLDVSNYTMFVHYGSNTDPISTIAGYIKSGYNGGGWNGPGIISSAAQTPTNGLTYALGYADGMDGVVSGLSSGQVEVKYTLVGDANLDGQVNGEDFTLLAANFNQGVTGWDQGDFNYDGDVNGEDFTLLAANFNQGASLTAPADAAPAATAAPAPAAAATAPKVTTFTTSAAKNATAAPAVVSANSPVTAITTKSIAPATTAPKSKPLGVSKPVVRAATNGKSKSSPVMTHAAGIVTIPTSGSTAAPPNTDNKDAKFLKDR
jgi:hypothetical protein